MIDDILANCSEHVRGWPFQKGRSGNPVGRGPGSRKRATIAAAKLPAGASEDLTRRAVAPALAGDPMGLRLCVERILPVYRECAVKFARSAIKGPADIALAMKAVTSALADGEITPGEADRIAAVVDAFVRAIGTSDFERRLQELEGSFKAQDAARVAGSGSA